TGTRTPATRWPMNWSAAAADSPDSRSTPHMGPAAADTRRTAGAGWSSLSSVELDRLDLDVVLRLAVLASVSRAGRGDLVKRRQAGLVDGAEYRVIRRQLRVLVHQEELTAIGARARVGHRQRAARIHHRLLQLGVVGLELVGRVLVVELVSRAAGALARRVAALQHRQPLRGGQPV